MEHPIDLPSPKVVRCFFAKQFQPHLPAMELAWDEDAPGLAGGTWHFPGQVSIQGPAPRTFGVVIQRKGPDDYAVRRGVERPGHDLEPTAPQANPDLRPGSSVAIAGHRFVAGPRAAHRRRGTLGLAAVQRKNSLLAPACRLAPGGKPAPGSFHSTRHHTAFRYLPSGTCTRNGWSAPAPLRRST